MKFLLKKDSFKQDKYLIYSNETLYAYAYYDSKTQKKQLYNLCDVLLGEGFYDLKNTRLFYHMMPYYIQLHCLPNSLIRVDFKPFPFPLYYYEFEGSTYKVNLHWGYKVSIYENGYQVGAYFTGKTIKDNLWDMLLVIDDNLNSTLLLLLALHVSSDFTSENNFTGGNANYNIGFQLKRFDKNWNPS